MGTNAAKVKDVVCGMMISPDSAAANRRYEGTKYYFCAQGCAKAFDEDPKKYVGEKK
jgi:Cu+-exporting ATPase